MDDSSRDTKPAKPETEKKQPETVQLTAEELRAIAGGAHAGPPPPAAKDIIRNSGGTGGRNV